MIGYLSGKFLSSDGDQLILDVSGVGYQVLVSSRVSTGLVRGAQLELYIHTNLRENSLELFGFPNSWEKKVFLALTSVSGIGPRTAIALLGGIEPEVILSAVVRGDRLTLGGVSGVGKKTAERLIIELAEKARKLLTERPKLARNPITDAVAGSVTGTVTDTVNGQPLTEPENGVDSTTKKSRKKTPAQGASVSARESVDIADLWNEALGALVGLGYREGDAITAIRAASAKNEESGEAVSLEGLIKTSLKLASKGRA